MISLSIARFEEIDAEDIERDSRWILNQYEDIDAYTNLVFCERRVGYSIAKYYETYHKIPHSYTQGKTEGYEIEIICPDCFRDRMYDEYQQSYYCPVCEN